MSVLLSASVERFFVSLFGIFFFLTFHLTSCVGASPVRLLPSDDLEALHHTLHGLVLNGGVLTLRLFPGGDGDGGGGGDDGCGVR